MEGFLRMMKNNLFEALDNNLWKDKRKNIIGKLYKTKYNGYFVSDVFNNYENNESAFIKNNPEVILKSKNETIDNWTNNTGGHASNYEIQKYLREKQYTDNREDYQNIMKYYVNNLNNLISGKLNEDITIFRTTQIPVNKLQENQIIDNNCFITGSLSREFSAGHFNYGDAYSTTIEVKIPKGTEALYIGDKTDYRQNEYEILFKLGYGIKICSIVKLYDKDGDYMNTEIKGILVKEGDK